MLVVCSSARAADPVPPYPQSPVIEGLEWAPAETIVRRAKDGDNWPITWADDDALYTTWGDGTGFDPKVERKLSCGFARVTGPPDRFNGMNIRSHAEQLGEGRQGKKGWGILSVDGVLYLWFGHADLKGGTSQLAWSADHAQTWTFADWRFDEFGLIGFINFGKGYQGARDGFVYAYSHDGPRADTPADRFVLMRVPKDQITQRAAWEFLEGKDADGRPQWTKDITRRGAVFKNPDACLRSAITYNPGLRRYLWWQQLPEPEGHRDRGDTRFSGGFGVYDAPEPWGPWTTAFFAPKWDTGPGEHADFPSKWMSHDGRTLHLVFSGDDSFSVRKATVRLAGDWPRFRGSGGTAVSQDSATPVSWGDAQNVAWKAPLPGFGTSSPVIIDDRVFLTCYSGYGQNAENPGREEDLKRHLLCVDRSNGRIRWMSDVPAEQAEASYQDFLVLHGYASSTPTTDGERIYVCFGKSGTRAYDLDGNELWRFDVGAQAHYWGSAGSPVVHGDLLLINAAVESQTLFALDKRTGKEVWRAKGLLSSWSTPVVVDLPDGGQEIVLSVRSKLMAFDPKKGGPLWTCKTEQSYAAPTPAVRGDVLYAYAANPGQLIAVRAGGRGDVSQSHVVWRARGSGSGITSPLVFGEHVYSVDERGMATCVHAEDGRLLYTRRLGDGGRFYASPVVAGDKLYAVSREQGVFVLAASPELRLLAHNRFTDDTSVFNATPAVSRGQLFLRSDRFLYCLGSPSGGND